MAQVGRDGSASRGRARGNPFLTGPWAPVHAEQTNEGEVLHGAIPLDLSGSFVRTGPNPRFPELLDQRTYHFFSGNGMVHGVELGGGKATYRNRWVQTRRVRRDVASGGETVAEPAPTLPSGTDDRGYGMANTAMLYHGGRCLALDEGSQGAWQVALPSLDTVGFYTFGDELRHNFTAHPKVCGETGELHFFGYGRNDVSDAHIHYTAVDPDGNLQYKDLPVPFRQPVMAHDMALSRNHAIFFDMPLWDMTAPVSPDDPTRFGVLERGGSGEIQWFEAAGCYGYHTANAWDEDGCIELIYCSSSRFHFQRSNADSLFLHRWRFDLASGEVLADEDLCDVPCEFPIVNPAVVGLKTRYIWANVLVSEPSPLSSDAIIKYDVEAGGYLKHTLIGGRRGGECFFAPKPGATAEDDGYLLLYTQTPGSDSGSDLYIIDAATMDPEPVCVVSLGAFVPAGFHAFWVDADKYSDGAQRLDGLQQEPEDIPALEAARL